MERPKPDEPDLDAEAPEADVIEQHREVGSADEPRRPDPIPADVPEADAIDQSIEIPLDDEERDE